MIEIFAESDQTACGVARCSRSLHLSRGAGNTGVGVISAGLAGTIIVAASVDQSVGGNPNLLRDGAISGNPAYVYNTAGEAGFFDRLQQLVDGIGANRPFDPTALGSRMRT